MIVVNETAENVSDTQWNDLNVMWVPQISDLGALSLFPTNECNVQ